MKIIGPNYTQIPNVIFDYWMKILSPGEFKVLLCICRKTFGWQKEKDYISLRQLVEFTGLSKEGISKILSSLVDHGLILKIKSKTEWGDDAPNLFMINVEEKTGGSQLSCLQVVNSVDHQVVNSVDTQKKDKTKKRPTKEKEKEGGTPSNPLSASFPKKEKLIERTENVSTTEEEHSKLVLKYGLERVQRLYNRLSEWKMDTPRAKWKKNDYRSILRWVIIADDDDLKKGKSWRSTKEKNQSMTYKDTSLDKDTQKQVFPQPGLLLKMLQESQDG